MSPKGPIRRPRGAAVALLLGASCLALAAGVPQEPYFVGFAPSAHAQLLRKLIARLRGQKLPAGIVKAEGRTEATEVDVSSKYAGELAEISVQEGAKVSKGEAIGRVSSPEIEAQLRAAQANLETARHALAAAEADISTRRAAMEFAKSDFERGQELIKSGAVTKQELDQRQRNYDSAAAAVDAMIAQRDQAQASIKAATAKVDQVQSMIDDLVIVSPRNGRVQYLLAQKGETVAAGQPIMTIADLADVYMVIFLRAAEAGALGIGDDARVILDAAPDYVIPARVSFVASDSQFTPKPVETEDERAKLMFRVQLRIDPRELERYYGKVESGLNGAGFVRTKAGTKWPAELAVKLPPAPVTEATQPLPAPAPAAEAPAPPPVAPSPQSAAQAAAPAMETSATPVVPQAPKPDAEASTSAPAQAAEATASAPGVATAAPPSESPKPATLAQSPAPTSETPAAPPTAVAEAAPEPEAAEEFAPASIDELVGAWAASAADCKRLFQRRGRALAYRQPVDQFAQAAIVEPQRIRLPSATCRLETASREGGSLKLGAECADTISYTSRTVYVKLRSKSELLLSPTGDPVLATNLVKCPL